MVESGPVAFCGWLDQRYARPYRTEVQLYKSLLALKHSIDRDCIVTSQREGCREKDMSCGCPCEKGALPIALLRQDYPAALEGGGL